MSALRPPRRWAPCRRAIRRARSPTCCTTRTAMFALRPPEAWAPCRHAIRRAASPTCCVTRTAMFALRPPRHWESCRRAIRWARSLMAARYGQRYPAAAVAALGFYRRRSGGGSPTCCVTDSDGALSPPGLVSQQARHQATVVDRLATRRWQPALSPPRPGSSCRRTIRWARSLMAHDGRGIRAAAVAALGYLQAHDQAGRIADLLRDKDSDVRAAAAEALGVLQARDEVARSLNGCTNDSYRRGCSTLALYRRIRGQVATAAR